jgi:S1-C subfamily serine protease
MGSGYESKRLASKSASFFSELGLKIYTNPISSSRLLVPRQAFDKETSNNRGFAFERTDENMSLSFVAYPASEKSFSELLETFAKPTAQREISYSRLKKGFFISRGTFRGRYFYTWMSEVPGGSTGFTLSWTRRWDEAANKISILLANSFDPIGTTTQVNLPDAVPNQAPAPPVAAESPQSGTGTGIKLTTQGHVLTNFHVAGKCKSISLRKTGEPAIPADLVASDETNDLALLKRRHISAVLLLVFLMDLRQKQVPILLFTDFLSEGFFRREETL